MPDSPNTPARPPAAPAPAPADREGPPQGTGTPLRHSPKTPSSGIGGAKKG